MGILSTHFSASAIGLIFALNSSGANVEGSIPHSIWKNMTFSDWITLIATFVTIASMVVSIVKARSASDSSDDAKRAMSAVQLASVAERLKSAQEHIRDVAPEKVSQRGFKIGDRIDRIRKEFDSALSALPKDGLGGTARKTLTAAQTELNRYEASISSQPNSIHWQKLQANLQDTISDLTSTTSNLGEQND